MSIYQEILGDRFEQLHPKLQQRYQIEEGSPFLGKGMMHEINGGPAWLYPLFRLGVRWKLLFPERGLAVPFTVTNRFQIGRDGEQQIHWERVFHFSKKKRYFNALMSLDQNRSIIKDYLGEPALVYSDLIFTVTDTKELLIQSKDQRLVIGKLEVPLPYPLQGLATVREGYDDVRDVYTIHVRVRNPLLGHLFSYKGEFVEDE
ncbi:hypothetical protein NCCP2222_18190 [Sporosarcina sp. NCCP-2222]|uniref:DUF4166 domain-containing protein n=1 Tax=Sporosarcina sp. NCCP-2222 TaxID=2935073 RepID=UPI00208D5D73|nr:DUF4166 domain-containing protein [Sporosarcina sp. NCCP-2222]GKV55872.1 hypothetical protein NCCP2222_18190 [Sporosarcina sp. NCCP-2222]